MRYAYPFDMAPQPEGGFTVTFPDVPEAITEGDTAGEARERAEDALVTALSFYTDDGRKLPAPSTARGRPVAMVPPLVAAKLALHDAMLAAGMSNVEFGRRLDLDEKAVPAAARPAAPQPYRPDRGSAAPAGQAAGGSSDLEAT